MSMAQALVQVRDLAKHYAAAGKRVVHAVDGVSLAVARGETLGLVGESGCGKSTLARLICCLERPTNGEVLFKGIETQAISSRELRALRPRMQLIFQDPHRRRRGSHISSAADSASASRWRAPWPARRN